MEKEVDFLLTDEFSAFAAEISAIHAEKKKLKDEVKKMYDEFQVKISSLDAQAVEASHKWEGWKKEHTKEQSKK